MNHDDNGDWTVVDYRRGRDKRRTYNWPQHNDSRNRFYQPDHRQYYSGQRSNGRQVSNGQRFNGQRRSYASVTRAGPGTYGDHGSRQRYKEPGFKPQFFEPRYPTGYRNENYSYNSVRDNKQSHNNNKFNTQYKSNTYPTNRNSHQEKKQYNKQYRNNTYPTYRNTHQEKKPQSEDPDFLLKAHCIHTIIKTIHHLKNVSAEDPPPNIARMTEHLSTVIKPASPRPDTQALIEGNAKNWSFTTMLILRDHYTDEMEAQIKVLNTLSTYHWQNPLDVASSWARRNLGRRLQEETLEQAAALLTAQIVDRTVTAPAQPEQSVSPTAVSRPAANICVAQIHAPPAQIGSPSQTPVPHTSSTKTVNTTTTMTDPKGDSMVEVETEYRIPPSMVLTSPVPKPQRTRWIPSLTPRGRRAPSLTPQPPARSPPPPFNPAVATEEDSIFDLSLEELECALVPAALPQQPSCPVLSRSTVATRSLGAAVQSQLNTERQSKPTLPEPITPTRRPNKHLNTVKKLQDWGLSVGKKWLIMGDSNLARFPLFSINELQIDSYPGATFRHAEAIIQKATSSTVVEK
ncbi:Collagen alpha-1(XXVII) chain, partial [Dissostichus eleginoides]